MREMPEELRNTEVRKFEDKDVKIGVTVALTTLLLGTFFLYKFVKLFNEER